MQDSAPAGASLTQGGADPDRVFLNSVRSEMLRFAVLQLGDPDIAEDAVQDALLGALKNLSSFRSQASLRTWFIAVLKHKIADILRQRYRTVLVGETDDQQNGDGIPSDIFDVRGLWRDSARPGLWENPETAVTTSQFLAVFDACLNRLPPQQGRIFLMCEVIELSPHEISAELGLTRRNVHISLYRARMALRACLERDWFFGGAR